MKANRILSASLALLCAALMLPMAPVTASAARGGISVDDINRVAEEIDNVPDDFLEEVNSLGTDTISVEDFKAYVQQFKAPSEYIQRFFDDAVIYNDYGTIVYSPIDSSLPQNNLDWGNITKKGGEIKYIEDGVSKAIKGIDVSKYQGDIDWEAVAADGVKFAIIRVGYRGYGTGKLVIDGYFEQNVVNATAAGIDVGVYFFTQAATKAEAVHEAEVVLEQIKGYDITYPVVIDVEDAGSSSARTTDLTRKQVTDFTLAFCETVEEAGYRPMIYTNARWFIAKMDMARLTKYDKWLAQYYDVPFWPYDIGMWQYTGKGRVSGIQGNVDMNLSFVDYSKKSTKGRR